MCFVISAIVPPGCVVRPIGSKQGLAQRILGAKDLRIGSVIAGLRDRDFDDDVENHYDHDVGHGSYHA